MVDIFSDSLNVIFIKILIGINDADGKNLLSILINLGLVDICAYLHQPNHLLFEVSRCKQTIARPAIIDVIFLMIETVCTGFAGEENREDQESLCSIVFIAFDGLLLFTSD
ncbi:unnamed protein product [Rotaria sordida]|uniref:Uncharacterized protein n=1 Tax=Rotaria sordida TaxID=392033 RepID=A0A819RPE3_9BILA|nr:unnamed protein product [Rotaria sordida]